MEQAIINVEGTTTIETAAAAKKLIEMFGNRNIRAIAVNRVNDKSDEVIVELDFVPGLAPHLHGFTLQVNGLTCGYAGTGPSNLYEVLQAAGVSEAQVAREDITQKSTKTIPLRLERAVTQYGDFQYPDAVKITRDEGWCMEADMPKKWVKIKPPRKLTEEQYAELVRRGKELAERQRQAKNLVKE